MELARRKLLEFCYFTNPSYKYAKHLDFIAQRLEAVERGEITKLMIFVPPRHGKTELVSNSFPAWYLGHNPNKRVIHSSYSDTLSNTCCRKARDLVNDKRFYTVFGSRVNPEVSRGDYWEMSGHKGGMISSGVGGSITGFGADLFIIDDPFKNQQEAESQTRQEMIYDWYRSVVRTRLEPGASLILIMARWHQKDLAGKILDEEKDWCVINLPALAEEDDILGRKKGEALWPYRFDEMALDLMMKDSGSRVWNSLYQGHPVDPKGALIKRDWIRWYEALPPKVKRFGGIDTATSKSDVADDMAMVDIYECQEGFLHVDDVFMDKISVTGFAKHVSNQHRVSRYLRINLESNNAGEAVRQRIDEVGLEEKTRPPVHVEATDTDKVVRIIEFQHLIENGTVRFKRGNKKVADLVDHLCNFTGKASDKDDDIDALGFAIKAAMQGKREFVHLI